GDRVNGGRAPYGLGLGFGQSEMADFALAHEIGHGADGVLDRRLRIDPMLVIEVDRLDSEPLEARVARLPPVSGGRPGPEAIRPADCGRRRISWPVRPCRGGPGLPARPALRCVRSRTCRPYREA